MARNDLYLNGPVNFRETLAFIDSLRPRHVDDVTVWDLNSKVLTRTEYFETEGHLIVDAFDRKDDLPNDTDFFLYGTGESFILQLTDYYPPGSGSYGLLDLFRAGAFYDFSVTTTSSGAVVKLFGTDDWFDGQGTVWGGNGKDRITLEDNLLTERGDGGLSKAYGGKGADIITTSLAKSLIKGGKAADHIGVSAGRADVWGGEGWDTFVFNNGVTDFTDDGTDDSPIRARIHDWDGAKDSLIIAVSVYGLPPLEGAVVSLEEVYGAGTLADLDSTIILTDPIYGTYTLTFSENRQGDTVIRRTGLYEQAVNDKTYDEKIVIKGQGLDDIALEDIYLDSFFFD